MRVKEYESDALAKILAQTGKLTDVFDCTHAHLGLCAYYTVGQVIYRFAKWSKPTGHWVKI